MAHWRAWATAREIPDTELRPRLVDALDDLDEVVRAIECDPRDVVDMIAHLQQEAKDAEDARSEAEDKLEEHLQKEEDSETSKLKDRISDLEKELEDTRSTLAETRKDLNILRDRHVPLIEAYSDALAAARRFVGVAESAGVKTKHVRKASP